MTRFTKRAFALAMALVPVTTHATSLHASLDARDDDGLTPPDMVIRCERDDVVEVLRATGAKG